MTRGRIIMFVAVAAALAFWLAFNTVIPSDVPPSASSPLSGTRPDIVLITLDTFRADRLGPGLTPALEALAARGVKFTNARTTVPLTLPAHASLMTGSLPAAHGVRENGMTFKGGQPLLAGRLRSAGYVTGAFVGAFVLDRRFGLASGFGHYDDRIPRDPDAAERLEAERKAAEVVDAALAWLSGQTSPVFLWVHLYDPHVPYEPPAEHRRANPYDGEIAYADAQVGRLLQAVAARDASSKSDSPPASTLIVVAGDHGEGLGEHGEATHGMLAYDTTLRIPLIMAFASAGDNRISSRIVDTPVSIVDVAPTLLRLAGVTTARGDDAVGGVDLLSALPAERDVHAETVYPRAAGWHALAVLAGDRWKLIRSSEAELYDVAADPSERANVAHAHPAIVQGMSGRLDAPTIARGPEAAIDPAALERLRALGYVSGGAAPVDPRAPNPARVIDAWTAFERALGEVGSARAAAAVPTLRELSRRFPSAVLFRATLARALLESGDAQGAVAIYRQAVARHPADATLFHDLAVAARAAGDRAEALRAEQAALALNADYPAALNGLGLLHADAGRATDAAAAFERAAAADRANPSYWTNLGNARRELSELPAAEGAYRRALEVNPEYADALNGLGVLLVQRGAPGEAVPLFRRALERSPEFHEARLNLGIALQESGNSRAAAETYSQILATAPASSKRERDAARELLRTLK